MSDEMPQFIPARMINEFSYCPRLFFLEWVDSVFEDNHFTVDGRLAHRKVDDGEPTGALREPDQPWKARSVELSSARLGVSGKVDLVEASDGEVRPVDTKRGLAPDVPEGAFEPDRVQLCLYGLLLREQGYRCTRGELYFAASRTRVEVVLDDALVTRTRDLVAQARETARRKEAPPPLVGSAKCEGCSLAPLCLPDEVNLLRGVTADPPRPMLPARDDAQPLYVQEMGARIGVSGHCLEVKDRERQKIADAPLVEVSQVVVWGNVQISSQAIRELAARGIPVAWLSTGGWLSGVLDGLGHGHVALRQAQYAAASSAERSLGLARAFVATKILNCRTLLRRNHPGGDEAGLRELQLEAERALEAPSIDVLLGIEGNAARVYFQAFGGLLEPTEALTEFDFSTRNRRPPKDAVNALLSFAYSMLTKELAVAARVVGFDPYLGFLHQPRHGRLSLALDLMEEFRPLLADSVVVSVINTRAIDPKDFVRRGIGVTLNPDGRKKFLRAWERRLSDKVTHPLFGYRVSYRRILEMQVRLLARHLLGELPEYPGFRTR
ncbi:MAG: CRISPR-associated endonuclease Cas1 [Myxococcota bacterium]